MDSTAIESTDTTETMTDTLQSVPDSLYEAITGLTGTIEAAEGFGWVCLGFFATNACGLYILKSTFKGY